MNLWQLLIFKGSRKVSFGVWLFIVANAYLWFKVIQADNWMTCVLLASGLVGGGTAFDRWIDAKKQEPKA